MELTENQSLSVTIRFLYFLFGKKKSEIDFQLFKKTLGQKRYTRHLK